MSSGQMSAAGTRLQAARGIADDADAHFADVMRISRGTVDPALVRLAVDNAADTLHWLLDLGLEVEADHPVIHYGHEPYGTARTYWAARGGLAVLDVLRPELELAERRHNLTISLNTRLVGLVRDGGRVVGVDVEIGKRRHTVRAGAVLLTSGGFSANEGLFKRHTGYRRFGGGYAHANGGGLTAALAVGARISGGEHFLPSFAGVADPDAPGGVTFATQTYPQLRQPCEVYVDLDGRRFVREDEPSADARERALLNIREMTFWAVLDARMRREQPGFFLLDDATLANRFRAGIDYLHADSLEELTAAMGVDPATFTTTIAAFNNAITEGQPDPIGRIFRPLPVAEPPFYAVRHVGWSIVSFAGIDIDAGFRVLDTSGQPIEGLYAAGEIVGFAKTSGNSFCGGMSVTPAMTFGRLAGLALADGQAGSARGLTAQHQTNAGLTGPMQGIGQ